MRRPLNLQNHPQRIVALSAEAAHLLFKLGAWDKVVGVSHYASVSDAPPRLVVSGFSTFKINRILELHPDLVITFSDVQAEISATLARAGLNVLITNQRTLSEISDTILLLGRMVEREKKAVQLLKRFDQLLEKIQLSKSTQETPKVYFEEWHDPMISGICWVSELIDLAGGRDCFCHLRNGRSASQRIVTPREVLQQNPDVIIASWCGRKVDWDMVRKRPGWSEITAVKQDHLYEIHSSKILQPGLMLMDGAREIARILAQWRNGQRRHRR